MKRILALLIAVVLVAIPGAAGATPPSPVATPATNSIGDVYLALGDSIAAGVGASVPNEQGYPAVLAGYLSRLRGKHVDLVDLAVPGETSSTFLNSGQLDRATSTINSARSAGKRINPVTLTLGANDLLDATTTSARQQALATLAKNLDTILSRLTRALPGSRLIMTTYYDPTGTDPTLPESEGWWLAQLNQTIAAAARNHGATLIDISRVFAGHTADWTWYPTDIHPNNAGHLAIANAIWRTLELDTTPPTVNIERPTAGTLPRPIPTVIAKATDRVGVTDVGLVVDGKPGDPMPFVPAVGAYAMLWDTRSLPPGRHTIQVRASDAAGNIGTASLTVTVPGNSPHPVPSGLPSPNTGRGSERTAPPRPGLGEGVGG